MKRFPAITLSVLPGLCLAQTQEGFMAKVSDVFVNAGDTKKALILAKGLLATVDKNKELQTYANYLILTQLFQNQARDETLAKSGGRSIFNYDCGCVT